MAKAKENAALFDALDDLQKERGIPKEYMLERLSAALVSAYKKGNIYAPQFHPSLGIL